MLVYVYKPFPSSHPASGTVRTGYNEVLDKRNILDEQSLTRHDHECKDLGHQLET